ncbi:MAG TPA: hypothetical protein VL126_14140 [Bacteroidota bacterium]|nr:hypothetical protein [Bacteroidota bacterium]
MTRLRDFGFSRHACSLVLGILVCMANAHACPVCYGQTDVQTSQGMSMAVLLLGGVTAGVVAALGSFFMNIRRRALRANDEQSQRDKTPHA